MARKRNFLPEEHPEIFRPENSAAASRATKRGELRRLARGLYTWNLDEDPEQLVRRRWMDVAALYYPDAVVVDRSAVEGQPAPDGSLFLDVGPEHKGNRRLVLPGLSLRPRAGPGALNTDMRFGGLYRSSQTRTALENLRPSRARTGVARTLTRGELEEWLDRLASTRGEKELLRIRDEARGLAEELDLRTEQKKLDQLIGSLLGTRDAELVSEVGRARKAGAPFDRRRLELFSIVRDALAGHVAPARDEFGDPNQVFAFFEAYFSNFIEGTEFEVDEAEEIVFDGAIPEERPADAHDIQGTFSVVTDPKLRRKTPKDQGDLIELLRTLNRRILEGRPETDPGIFKQKPNRAGNTVFVQPDLVEGTLREGWTYYETLESGFARAVFAMFLVTEVHPFADGNGRVARALMNQEFSAAEQCRVLIPLSFRSDYLGALRAMSRRSEPEPLVRMVDRAQRWSSLIDWSTRETARAQLEETNALVAPEESEEGGVLLRDPS